MPLLVLGGRPSHPLPAAGAVVLKPLAAFAPVHVAIAPCVRVDPGSPDSTAPEMPPNLTRPAGEAGAVAPVMENVHPTEAMMPEVMPEGEAELEVGEEADAEAQVERTPAR